MKRVLLLALALPLAGCGERAELAERVGKPAEGPFTLRYKLTDQDPNRYRITVDGETTTGFRTAEGTAAETTGEEKAPERTLQGRFHSEMVVRQHASPTAGLATERAPGDQQGEGVTPEREATTEPTEPEATQGTPGTMGTPGELKPFQVRQEVQEWSAHLTLPEGGPPNEISGEYRDGEMNVQAQGMTVPVPQRFREQFKNTLERPVTAVVTPKGEILRVEWPLPQEVGGMAGVRTEQGPEGVRALTGSTELLNLWFGIIRLPDEPVKVGETWDVADQFPVMAGNGQRFHMRREAKYTLSDVEPGPNGQMAVIDVNETLKLVRGEETAESAQPAAGTEAAEEPTVLQTRMGKIHFNIDRGAIDRAEQQVSMTWDTQMRNVRAGGEPRRVATQGSLSGTIQFERLGAEGTEATTGTETGETGAMTEPGTEMTPGTEGATEPGMPETRQPATSGR